MQLQNIRHATLLLQDNTKKLLVDPMLSPKGIMPAIDNVPNQNNNPLVDLSIPISDITDCDAVFITHTHRDHFDEEAVKLLSLQITVFCQPEDKVKITGFGFKNVIEVIDTLEWEGINIKRTKGKHGHGAIAKAMAPVSGFVLSANEESTVYLTGDTIWYLETEKILQKYNPEIMICNCGDARFYLGKSITMNAKDILSITKRYPNVKVIAIHMEAWNHCRLSRKELHKITLLHNIDKQVYIPADGELLVF